MVYSIFNYCHTVALCLGSKFILGSMCLTMSAKLWGHVGLEFRCLFCGGGRNFYWVIFSLKRLNYNRWVWDIVVLIPQRWPHWWDGKSECCLGLSWPFWSCTVPLRLTELFSHPFGDPRWGSAKFGLSAACHKALSALGRPVKEIGRVCAIVECTVWLRRTGIQPANTPTLYDKSW